VRPTKTSRIILAGLLIREAFSFWTGHPFDFELWVRTGFWVDHGVSPYSILPEVPGLSFANIYSPLGESTVGYLPFWPLLLGGIYKLYTIVGFGNRFVYYFLIKQPLILGDMFLGYAIFSYVRAKRPEAGNGVLSLWLLSPLTIIISSIWGMFDSLAMLFVVAALAAENGSLRSASEGLAVWIKSIPLIYAIPIAFSTKKWMRNLALSLGLPAAGSLAIIIAFGWPISTAVATLGSTVTKGGQSLSATGFPYYLQSLNLALFSEEVLKLVGYLWIPALVVATVLSYRWFGFTTQKGRVQSLIFCTIAFMLFKAQVNEQYSIYLLALALVDVGAWSPNRRWLYIAITSVVMVYLVVNNPGLVRFISPVDPQATTIDAQLSQSLGNHRILALFGSSIAFSALNVLYAALLIKDRKTARVELAQSSL
jgi:hypothetical protein